MKQAELDDILEKHKLWLTDNKKGVRADLSRACAALWGAHLSHNHLRSANLSHANLSHADLRGVDLSYANMSYANLSHANLSHANLSYANLSYTSLPCTNLSYANLMGVHGERRRIKSIFISNKYPVTYTDTVLQIGCERHYINEWWGFDDQRIIAMDNKTALKWWRKYKDMIRQIIEHSPAV